MNNHQPPQLNNALKIMEFCKMKNSTSAVEYFKQTRTPAPHTRKAIIKKHIADPHLFKKINYINPNIQSLLNKMESNNLNTKKIINYINNLNVM